MLNILIILFCLQCYGLYQTISGEVLTPDITFSSLSIFNNMFVPLIVLPSVFTFFANAIVSTGRLRTFFSAPEVEDNEDGRTRSQEEEEEENDLDDASVRWIGFISLPVWIIPIIP